MTPRFIHIGPDQSGEWALSRMFRAAGLGVACHEKGRLAADVLYARACRAAPLRQVDQALIAGLYRHTPFWRPPIEGWHHADYLRAHFPDAVFILTVPDVDDWLLRRVAADDGAALRCYTHHLGLSPDALADRWHADLTAHLEAVTALFGDDPRLIRVDLTTEPPADLAARLAEWMSFPAVPQGWYDPADALPDMAMLDPPKPPPVPDGWADDVAAFCLRGVRAGAMPPKPPLSDHAGAWDGGAFVQHRGGHFRPFVVADGPVGLMRGDRHPKTLRVEGVINDILRLNRRDPVWMDMEDSRWIGSPHDATLPAPVIGHNRREDAENVVLWPLPGQHEVGQPGFDGVADRVAWDDKADRVVWRGMISGSERRNRVRPGPASHVFLKRLMAAGGNVDRRATAWAGLCRTSRFALIRRLWQHPDFDLGVVMAWGFRAAARDPWLAPYCVPRQDRAFFHQFRYQLCLTGYDHPSNFMQAIDTQGVALVEDDGWQVFYSGRFRPWEHYIPIQRYGDDIQDKLAWARAHPAECRAMSAAARSEAAHFRNPAARRDLMARILDGLAAMNRSDDDT
ncbi:glycosyl transferase family 90 [Paracoccus sp. (in: a-proteobacteria)]|uniref:glycosyl transferase family 90 n=1 Tax=Paracoccus sp. TaxID=267 RepID=UPI0026E0DFA8|nr:glycosyl transferase family 90 [Paracoccus sp. (in: a-proteobacteria)]MDO5648324.1 glycosyl transferase family 90 [Paracoccus sp. (in: a-proteobacteria)]